MSLLKPPIFNPAYTPTPASLDGKIYKLQMLNTKGNEPEIQEANVSLSAAQKSNVEAAVYF